METVSKQSGAGWFLSDTNELMASGKKNTTYFHVLGLGQVRRRLPEALSEHVVNQDTVQPHAAPSAKFVRVQSWDGRELLQVL